MFATIKETILNIQTNGSQSVLETIQENKLDLEQLEHVVYVINFCNELELILNTVINELHPVFLKLFLAKKQQKINNKYYTFKYIGFKFQDSKQITICKEIKERQLLLYSLVNKHLVNFYNINETFINSNIQEKDIIIPLTLSGIENIRQNLLNKDMYIAYQFTQLQKTLKINNYNNDIIKI